MFFPSFPNFNGISFFEDPLNLGVRPGEKGNHPFGALLVLRDKMVLEARNSVVTEKDVTRHAELNLISKASRKYPPSVLKKAVLFSSTEPCAMCAGAIYWAGIRHVVFGCSAKTLAEYAGGSLTMPCEGIFFHGREKTFVEGPILESESRLLHENFWN